MTPPVILTSLESGIGSNGREHNPEPAPVKSLGDEEVATSEVSSATDEAVARCESGVGGERSRSSECGAGRGSDTTGAGARKSRPTYRERRAARAERLRGWADKREHDAGAVLKSHEVYRGDHAFNFQPGHIPERARVIRQDHRAFESLDKARSMSSRADEIERQAEHAIYSDDEDAVERLQERIAELEAKRDRMKAENAAYRREHRDELRAMSVYERNQVLPNASFTLTNLSANINRQKKRLAAFERGAA